MVQLKKIAYVIGEETIVKNRKYITTKEIVELAGNDDDIDDISDEKRKEKIMYMRVYSHLWKFRRFFKKYELGVEGTDLKRVGYSLSSDGKKWFESSLTNTYEPITGETLIDIRGLIKNG